jgi:hypothetical protein
MNISKRASVRSSASLGVVTLVVVAALVGGCGSSSSNGNNSNGSNLTSTSTTGSSDTLSPTFFDGNPEPGPGNTK